MLFQMWEVTISCYDYVSYIHVTVVAVITIFFNVFSYVVF